MVVASLAPAEAEPPPEMLTWFVTGDGAFDATLTVTAMLGSRRLPGHRCACRRRRRTSNRHPTLRPGSGRWGSFPLPSPCRDLMAAGLVRRRHIVFRPDLPLAEVAAVCRGYAQNRRDARGTPDGVTSRTRLLPQFPV